MSSMDEMMKAMGLPTGFHSKKSSQVQNNRNTSIKDSNKTLSLDESQSHLPLQDKQETLKDHIHSTNKNRIENENTNTIKEIQEEDFMEMPFTSSALLKGHSKVLSAITLDTSGSRLITGARDNQLYLWNFNTMDKRLAHFKSFEPVEGNIITDLQFGSSGDRFLLATPETYVRLYNRDGEELCSFTKGDPYVRDPRRTLGHTSSITLARWHPIQKHVFYTASFDSTIRIWDVNDRKQQKSVIPVKSKSIGNRTPITTACVSPDGKQIVAGIDFFPNFMSKFEYFSWRRWSDPYLAI